MIKTRVVLVDDHILVRAGIRSLLEKMPNIEVAGEADHGRDAISLIKTTQPDVVLMDIAMKGLNGLETSLRIAKESPKTKILILTMLANEDFVAQALRNGARGYLLKDAATSELEQAISAVSEGKTYLSSSIARLVEKRKMVLDNSHQSPLEQLTPRQREILQLIAEGKSTKEIAHVLNVSAKTVETHRALLMDRLGIRDVPGLVRYAIRIGLVQPEP